MELTEHHQSFEKKSKKHDKIAKKSEPVPENEDKKKLKKVFPDSKDKTEKHIGAIKKKIENFELNIKKRVNLKFNLRKS